MNNELEKYQTRNILIYAVAFWMNYLSAPVIYVGVLQVSLLTDFQAPAFVATLPGTAYTLMTITPLFVAWLLPYVSFLKRNIIGVYAINAASMIAMAMILLSSLDTSWKIAAVVIQAGIIGGCVTTGQMLLWEMIGRGTSENKRGSILALTFGAGPVLAVIGSLVSQAVLTGKLGDWTFDVPHAPYSYALLYVAASIIAATIAVAASFIVIPLPEKEVERESFFAGTFGILRDFSTNRVLLIATIATVLFYSANTIVSIMSLYTELALNAPPSESAGYQNTLRFAFKAVAGIGLGWLLAKTNPKTTMLTTAGFFLLGQLWAMTITGPAYLLAFGLFGIGELIGVYGPNYILSASRKEDYRRNMAVIVIIGTPTAFTGQLFGGIVSYCNSQGHNELGFQVSFGLCMSLIMAGMVLASWFLPAQPSNKSGDI